MFGLHNVQPIELGLQVRSGGLHLLKLHLGRRELLLQAINPTPVGPWKLGANHRQPHTQLPGHPQSHFLRHVFQHVLHARAQVEGDLLIKPNLATEEGSGQ